MKAIIGLILAFAIGFACRALGIPSPAPPVIAGALLVAAMTVGYILVDRFMNDPARHAANCGGPSGLAPSAESAVLSRVADAGEYSTLMLRIENLLSSLATSGIRFIALLALCSAYLQGGLVKLTDFGGAVAEAQHFGLPAASLVAVATIITELGGSALILTGFYRWIGAIWLAGFTLIATFVANPFWQIPQPDRFMVENSFFEHLGLVGGFLIVGWWHLTERRTDRTGSEDARIYARR
jgi:XapX domain-containing protein